MAVPDEDDATGAERRDPPDAPLDDGGDVAGRDPDAIAREIEQTRAELAETIDAIAERISPKRAASRGAQAVKAQVSSARGKVSGETPAASPSGVDGDPAAASGGSSDAERSLASIGPKVAVAGVVLVIVVFLLRRRSR